MTHFVNFWLLAGIFWRIYRNCFLRALKIVLKEKNLSKKEVFFQWFSHLEQKKLDFQQTKSAAMQKFWLISAKEFFEENNVAQNKSVFVFFKFWAKNVGKLPKKIWLRPLNCILKVQGKIIHHISWCSMTHFVNLWPLAEIFWRVYRNCFLWALRIVLKERNPSNKQVFLEWSSELEQKYFRFPAKKSVGMP